MGKAEFFLALFRNRGSNRLMRDEGSGVQ